MRWDEPHVAARPDDHPKGKVPRRAVGTTGLQAADAILESALDGIERIMAPTEVAVALDLHHRRVEVRLAQHARWLERLGIKEAA